MHPNQTILLLALPNQPVDHIDSTSVDVENPFTLPNLSVTSSKDESKATAAGDITTNLTLRQLSQTTKNRLLTICK